MQTDVVTQAASREKAAVGYQWLRRPRRLLALMDGIAAMCALVTLLAMNAWRPMVPTAARTAEVGVALVLLLTMVLGFREGQYTNSRRLSRLGDAGRLAVHLLIATSVVALLGVITKGFFVGSLDASRLLLGISLLVFFSLGALSRLVLAVRQRAMFMKGVAFRRVLVLGSGQAAADFIRFLSRRPWLGIACAGRLEYRATDDGETGATDEAGVRQYITSSYAGFENLDRAWCASGASEVVVALDPEDSHHLLDITKMLSLAHVPFRVVPSLFEESYRAAELMGYGELPVIDVDVDPLDRVERVFKRCLDIGVSSAVLLLGLIPGLLLMVSIKLDSPGPVFYKQARLGRNGRRFWMYKFRTMVTDADALIKDLTDRNEKGSGGQLFKMKDDPRITRVGGFLRKWSLDELPQLINVYKGEMSLVGPRPPLPREVENYCSQHYCRLKGLPGITGLWQVSGRSDLSFEEMVKLDKYYLDNWSLGLDLSILFQTFFAVITRKGAY